MLYTQLCFYEHIFDAERALKGMTDGSKEKCKLQFYPILNLMAEPFLKICSIDDETLR